MKCYGKMIVKSQSNGYRKNLAFSGITNIQLDLCDFVISDIDRISKRMVMPLKDWREDSEDAVPAVAVEEPVYRREFGLWEHQKYFVELAFREHKQKGGARLLLAD